MLPLFYPEKTPKPALEPDSRIVDPVTNKMIVGTRVSMEDLLVLRKCIYVCMCMWGVCVWV